MLGKHRALTLVEVLVILWVIGLLVSLVGWPYRGLEVLVLTACVAAIVAVFVGIRRGWKAFAIFCSPAVLCLIAIAVMLPNVFPTQFNRVDGGEFEDIELVKVFSTIAAHKTERPAWRFRVPDRELAHTRISVAIPPGCRLNTALELIANAADCEYDWHWCGVPPSRADFLFYRRGTKVDWPNTASVNIDHNHVWQFRDEGMFEYRDNVWKRSE